MANVALTRGRKVEHVSGNWRMCDLLQRWTASHDSSRGQQMSDSDAMLALSVGKVVNFHLAARSNAVWLVLPPTTCERLASLAYSIRKLPSSTPSVFNDQRVIIYEFINLLFINFLVGEYHAFALEIYEWDFFRINFHSYHFLEMGKNSIAFKFWISFYNKE